MKIVFMGSSTFAIPSLRVLKEAQYDVKAVYSQPPRKAGRGKSYKEVPLAEFAFSEGLKVEQPATTTTKELESAHLAVAGHISRPASRGTSPVISTNDIKK